MEKTVFQHLLDVMVGQLQPDLLAHIALLCQSRAVVDGNAAHVFHHQHPGRGVLPEDGRAPCIRQFLAILAELCGIGRFLPEKVQLLLGRLPHLVQHHVQVHCPLQAGELRQPGQAAQQGDVLGHGHPDAGPLKLLRRRPGYPGAMPGAPGPWKPPPKALPPRRKTPLPAGGQRLPPSPGGPGQRAWGGPGPGGGPVPGSILRAKGPAAKRGSAQLYIKWAPDPPPRPAAFGR